MQCIICCLCWFSLMVVCFLFWQSLRAHKSLLCEKSGNLSSILDMLSLKWVSNIQVHMAVHHWIYESDIQEREARAGYMLWRVSIMKFWKKMRCQMIVEREKRWGSGLCSRAHQFRHGVEEKIVVVTEKEQNLGEVPVMQVQRILGFRKKK